MEPIPPKIQTGPWLWSFLFFKGLTIRVLNDVPCLLSWCCCVCSLTGGCSALQICSGYQVINALVCSTSPVKYMHDNRKCLNCVFTVFLTRWKRWDFNLFFVCPTCVFFAVKPDPPESVEAQELEGFPTRLRVSWSYPSSWPEHDAFPLLFQIRYRPQGSRHWSEVSTEESSGFQQRWWRCNLN